MRPIAKIMLMTGFACLAGCAAHVVRCDERLEAINAPRPRPTRGADPAAGTDAAPSADPAAGTDAAASADAAPKSSAAFPATTPPSGP
jgi:hypothetical protein